MARPVRAAFDLVEHRDYAFGVAFKLVCVGRGAFPLLVRGFLISSLSLYVSAFESVDRTAGRRTSRVLESVFCAPRCLMRNDAAGTITSFLFCLNSTPFLYCRSLNSSKRHSEHNLLLEVWQHMYVYCRLCVSG